MLVTVLLLHWQVNVQHEVGGVTSGGKGSCSSSLLVNWAAVGVSIVNVSLVLWHDVDHLHIGVKNLWIRLFQGFLSVVPSAAFNEKTVDVNSIFWWLAGVYLSLVKDLKVHVDLINGNDILSSIVLFGASEE